MKNKDKLVFDYINKHYNELKNELFEINDSYEEFIINKVILKAITFDVFQIGELFNSLSEEVVNKLNKTDIRGIIDVRNYIAHGYIYVKNSEIWKTIHNDLPRLIVDLQNHL